MADGVVVVNHNVLMRCILDMSLRTVMRQRWLEQEHANMCVINSHGPMYIKL